MAIDGGASDVKISPQDCRKSSSSNCFLGKVRFPQDRGGAVRGAQNNYILRELAGVLCIAISTGGLWDHHHFRVADEDLLKASEAGLIKFLSFWLAISVLCKHMANL